MRPLAEIRPEAAGLPPAAAKELALAHAWRRAAGAVLYARLPALRIRRGVLEVGVPDPRWAEAMRPLLPKLVGRMAAAAPDLRITRFRVVVEGGTVPDVAIPVERAPGVEPPSQDADTARAPVAAETLEIGSLAERYLSRSRNLGPTVKRRSEDEGT
jgi:hypothetical protein